MTKQELAKQLREKSISTGLVNKSDTDVLSDDQMIDCYNTCSCCGEKFLNSLDLELAIKESNNADEFFEISKSLEYKNKDVTKN